MKCFDLKGQARDVVWGGRVALAVVLLPLFVPIVLFASVEHVLTEWLYQLAPNKHSKACR